MDEPNVTSHRITRVRRRTQRVTARVTDLEFLAISMVAQEESRIKGTYCSVSSFIRENITRNRKVQSQLMKLKQQNKRK